MKMDIVAGSKNDEFYTPVYAIEPIEKYLKKGSTIWCPFDTEESNYVKYFKEKGYNVIHSHIDEGENFFLIEPKECDYIISNPPYSLKGQVLYRLFEIGKPFAMLLGIVGLFESKARFDMFKNNNFEIMYLNKRVSYFKDYKDQKPSLNPPFSSAYICKDILPNRIVFEEINK
ncbi:MAG: sugar-phospahte nucleotidyltransferase [Tyzzerella sp.]|uniref:Sugar-phospahte nucleotidyltransferase n=1 Tax=Candidatus Fimicola merdigallinarum TaxID=2840819 RepID=A0A9D9DWX5_9FIRM|nr:sugar-phospahte nucleotidyltransferase [Candidatus Fimicola merdigallinarum]